MIRVGRIKNTNQNLEFTDKNGEEFIPIIVMMKSSKYYSLSPYSLKLNNKILENIWQFSKVYTTIPYSKQTYSQYDKTVIWEHPKETHVICDKDNNLNLTNEYYSWRKKGMFNPYAVRYPVGFDHRTQCIGSLKNKNDDQLLDYIQARKEIYLPNYLEAIKDEPQFLQLTKLLQKGKNLLITEVDGPHQESLDYYIKKYNVGYNFIENSTILATDDNLNIMLNDTQHAFGHGYCLAKALLNFN